MQLHRTSAPPPLPSFSPFPASHATILLAARRPFGCARLPLVRASPIKVRMSPLLVRSSPHRYNREHVLRHTPAVRALVQQEIAPQAALSLLVSAVHLRSSRVGVDAQGAAADASGGRTGHQGGQQQQQQQQQQQRVEQAAGEDRLVAVELTDGWYSVQAQLDGPLAQLALCGKLKVTRCMHAACARTAARAAPEIRTGGRGCVQAPPTCTRVPLDVP